MIRASTSGELRNFVKRGDCWRLSGMLGREEASRRRRGMDAGIGGVLWSSVAGETAREMARAKAPILRDICTQRAGGVVRWTRRLAIEGRSLYESVPWTAGNLWRRERQRRAPPSGHPEFHGSNSQIKQMRDRPYSIVGLWPWVMGQHEGDTSDKIALGNDEFR